MFSTRLLRPTTLASDRYKYILLEFFLFLLGCLLYIAFLSIKLDSWWLYIQWLAIIVYSKIPVSKNSYRNQLSDLKSRIDVLRISIFINTIEKLHLMAVLFVNFILFLIFVLYITRYIYDPLSFESISAEFMKQICDLALCSESILGIILSSVQQQPIDVNILNRFA